MYTSIGLKVIITLIKASLHIINSKWYKLQKSTAMYTNFFVKLKYCKMTPVVESTTFAVAKFFYLCISLFENKSNPNTSITLQLLFEPKMCILQQFENITAIRKI